MPGKYFYSIPVKPLSVNQVWQGKRFKTGDYKAFEQLCGYALPPKIEIPDGELEVYYEFGVSNFRADVDNFIKPFTDILQKKYGFNDARIVEVRARKKLVAKGEEYIRFSILPGIDYEGKNSANRDSYRIP